MRACALALLAGCALTACDDKEPRGTPVASSVPPPGEAPRVASDADGAVMPSAGASSTAPAGATLPPMAPTAPTAAAARPAACDAPSVTLLHAPDDARDFRSLASCTPYDAYLATCDDEQPVAAQCGQQGHARAVDMKALLDAVLPIDPATLAHVRTLFAAGKARGRRANVFGLVGDSITIDHSFMRPFGAASSEQRVALSPPVRDALRIDDTHTVIDLFRGGVPSDAGTYDSFRAPRAAKIGARVKWAISYNAAMHATPVEDLVSTVSPAYAIVMYGTNDAQWWLLPPEQLARDFGGELRALVDTIESLGVIPVLTTIPKHLRNKRFPDCPTAGSTSSNTRYAIQTNVVSATIAQVACERALPLIDYRYALDGLLAHGVGADGVHPSLYYRGAGALDEQGLACGFNVRNFVTLRMLKVLRDALREE